MCITNMPGDGEVTYPSETGQALIPYQVVEETYDYYEVRNYVNDINQEYAQVLSGYDEKGRIRESYTYGITGSSDGSPLSETGAAIGGRLDYSDGKNIWYYGYTGTGSTAQLTDKEGALAVSYSYDAFGNTVVRDYIGNITGNRNITENYTLNPYTYNAEYTDASTGNQFLRARYYNPETGSFFTEDSYLGSLLEPLERNLYTYAENDPVNYRDPSGHGIKDKLQKAWNRVKSTASNAWNKVKSTASNAWSTVKRTAANIYNKARDGLNNYMNSDSYKSYFGNSGSSGGGASTGNRYVGRSSGSGSSGGGSSYSYYGGSSGGKTNGYTSYSYVRYNPNPPHKLTIGGKTRYFQTEAEMNTVKQVCSTARRINKDEMSIKVNLVTNFLSNINYTNTKGVNVSLTVGMWTFDASVGISIDAKGNLGIQHSLAGGVTTAEKPSAAIAVYETVTNAPDIYALEGEGINIGGAVAGEALGLPAYASGDIAIVGDVNSMDKHYYGVTGALGVGSDGKEAHIEVSNSKTDWSINIKDLFKL